MGSFDGENMQTQYSILFYFLGMTYVFTTISSQEKLMRVDTATEILSTK